jgi:hypothetical protein
MICTPSRYIAEESLSGQIAAMRAIDAASSVAAAATRNAARVATSSAARPARMTLCSPSVA